MLYTLTNLGILCAASAWEYWNYNFTKENESSTPKVSTAHHRAEGIADRLDNYAYMLGTAKKVLKWAKKGLSQLSFALRSGLFTQNLLSWARSPKAIQFYIMMGGTLALTYQNWKNPKTSQGLFKTASAVAWSLTAQSKKIIDSYNLIMAASALLKKPKDHLLPMSFAATMVLASYLYV